MQHRKGVEGGGFWSCPIARKAFLRTDIQAASLNVVPAPFFSQTGQRVCQEQGLKLLKGTSINTAI